MSILQLAFKSVLYRRGLAFLCVLTVALSSLLLLGVERLRHAAKDGFTSTVSNIDLIVGPRMGDVQLLMQSVFFTGTQGLSMPWRTFEKLQNDPRIQWAVPLNFGDYHQGLPVVGTTKDYFKWVKTTNSQPLKLQKGSWFSQQFEVVLGAKAAQNLGVLLGHELLLRHGEAMHDEHEHDGHKNEAYEQQEHKHADAPFKVVGILRTTGTPIDNALFVDLDSLERIHDGWEGTEPGLLAQAGISTLSAQERVQPQRINVAYFGLRQPEAVLGLQSELTRLPTDILTAVIPAVGLTQIWQMTHVAEKTLQVLATFAVLIGLLGMMGVLLAGLQARKQEMQVLRIVGARPQHIIALVVGESFLLSLLGLLLSFGAINLLSYFAQDFFSASTGLYFSIAKPQVSELLLVLTVLVAACLVGLVPAVRAYRSSKV